MAGFWSGFAQGWEAESERIERRKLFQQEQKERRLSTLGELLPKLKRGAALGGSGGDDATPTSSEQLGKLIIKAGGSPEMVASLDGEGGATALNVAWQAIQKVRESGQPITPELFTQIQDSIVVTKRQGQALDLDALLDQMYGPEFSSSLSPDERMLLEMQMEAAQGSQEPEVGSTFIPPEPVKPEEIKSTVELMNSTLMARLADQKAIYDNRSVDINLSSDEQSKAAEEASKLEAMMKQVEAGNVISAANTYGQDIIGPILQNNPLLAKQPALLGPWAPIAERYTSGETQEEQPIQSSEGLSFESVEEAKAAQKAGQIPPGAIFYINGEPIRNDL